MQISCRTVGRPNQFHWVVTHEFARHGFRKNKSMEKQPESEEDLLEHRTDGTDAFDTLYIGCEKFPQHDFYPIAIGGVRQNLSLLMKAFFEV